MKKSLVALAAFAAAGVVSAQSSVTLYGIVDLGFNKLASDGNGHVNGIKSNGNTVSRIGFRGVEDLGGGLKASFRLEGNVLPDSGAGFNTNLNNTPAGNAPPAVSAFRFDRGATLGLSGSFGEVRLGRSETPSYLTLISADPFGGAGVGQLQTLIGGSNNIGLSSTVPKNYTFPGIRASNAVEYLLPGGLGGLYGHFQYALGEQLSNSGVNKKNGNTASVRVGFANGPVNVSVSYLDHKFAPSATTGKYRLAQFAGSYNFGFAKVLAYYGDEKQDTTALNKPKSKIYSLSGVVPYGAGEFKLTLARANVSGTSNDANFLSVGYVYNLSKRTALYTTYAQIDNKGTGTGFDLGHAVVNPGGNSKGFDFGVRHAF